MKLDLERLDLQLFDLIKRCRHLLRRHRLCLLVTLTLILILLLTLTLSLTLLRPHHPVTAINSIRLSSLAASLFLSPAPSADLNLTLAVGATVSNPNRVAFRYPDGGSAELYYRGSLAGGAAIPPGEVGARGLEAIDVELTVFAGRLVGDVEIYTDLIRGWLDVTALVRIKGKVKILGVKHRVVTYTTCDVRVSIRNRTVDDTNCWYRIKY